MRWIVASSLRFRYIVVGVAAAFLFFGLQDLRHEKVDVFPEFAPTRVEIQTACVGLSSSEVEELVSVPLEDALNGVPGVDVIRSTSVGQLSSIELLFKRGTNYVTARQLVQERLQTVVPTLPTWAAPPVMMQPVSATSRIMKVGLTSKSMSLMDMSLTAYWKIRARLLRVPGVANVAIWGERLKDMTVQVDPQRMERQRVSLDKLMSTTSDALDTGLLQYTSGALIGTGGVVDTGTRALPVTNALPVSSPIDNLSLAVLIGCALVVLVLVLFLYEWRAALISLLAIPLSLVAAALVLHVEGATINTMILAGFAVAVGVVVDDAIIDMENIVRRLRQWRAQGRRTTPLHLLLAVAYALAVLASMVVALTVTPALAMVLMPSARLDAKDPPVVARLKRR